MRYQEKPYEVFEKLGYSLMGFEASVGAGDEQRIILRPFAVCKPERLHIRREDAQAFVVLDIFVGTYNAFIADQIHPPLKSTKAPIPADAFTIDQDPKTGQYRPGQRFDIPACQISQDMGLTVRNISGCYHVLRGAFICRTNATYR